MDVVIAALREFAVPLVALDSATLHVVAASASAVHLHLGGAYSGCAGRTFVERSLLAPVIASVLPSAALTVTSGYPLPPGAKLLTAGESATSTSGIVTAGLV